MLAFLPYGERFTRQRKYFQRALSRQGAATFRPSQLRQAHILLENILNNPDAYLSHIRRQVSFSRY